VVNQPSGGPINNTFEKLNIFQMEKTNQDLLEKIAVQMDVLIKQVSILNEGLRKNKLAELNTEILDRNEAAAYLKVNPQFLKRLRDQREIVFYQRDLLVRYKKSDLDKWLTSYQVGR
jgi:uncharacterized protein (DUF2225 family)